MSTMIACTLIRRQLLTCLFPKFLTLIDLLHISRINFT
jgi:hypothetical protein